MNFIKSILFPVKNEQTDFWSLLFGWILIVGFGIKCFWGIQHTMDVLLWDETNYLRNGVNFLHKIPKNWGPIYSLWYFVLHFIQPNMLKLYFLNYQLMAIIPAMVFFWFLLSRGINFFPALLVNIFWIASSVNITVWPKVSFFCLILMLTGIIISLSFKKNTVRFFFLSFTALCMSYARPEFYLSFLVLMLLSVIVFIIEKPKIDTKNIVFLGGLLFTSVILHIVLGSPLFGDSRSVTAFAQHYMLNYYQWKQIDLPFWMNWKDSFDQVFKNAETFGDVVKNNPAEFQKHILSNTSGYTVQFNRDVSDILLPKKIFHLQSWLRWLLFLTIIIVFAAIKGFTQYFSSIKKGISNNFPVLFILLSFSFPAFISAILIYPREHYFILQLPFILFFLMILFFDENSAKNNAKNKIPLTIILIGGLMFLSPGAKDFRYFNLWNDDFIGSQPNLHTIRYLQTQYHTSKNEINILENEGGINSYLGKKYKWQRGFSKDTGWNLFLREKNIDIIYVTPLLRNDPRFVKDPEWQNFVKNPEKNGFITIKTGNFDAYLLIKKESLQ